MLKLRLYLVVLQKNAIKKKKKKKKKRNYFLKLKTVVFKT